MLSLYRSLQTFLAQSRAGTDPASQRLDALIQEVRNMSKGLDALKAADTALAQEVQNATVAMKADSDKLAAALAASEGDNDDEVVAAAQSLQGKVDQLHQLFTPAAPAAGATGA